MKYAAQTEFTKEVFFIPELLEEAQALDLKKKIDEAQIVIALFANRQLLHSLGEHFKVIAICEQNEAWPRGGSELRQLAIDALMR